MFGAEILDASLGMSLVIALFAGVISFLSPCVLPIVPPYLAYMAGTSTKGMLENEGQANPVILPAVFFVMGLSTVFLLLGVAASAFGQAILQYQDLFGIIAGCVIILFGLHFLGLFKISLLYREARIDAGDQRGSPVGAYFLGLAFAFGWTPCIGPILAGILTLIAQEGSLEKGMLTMGFYAIGLGLPFLLAAIFINRFMGVMGRLKSRMALIEKLMGALLVVVGVLLITGRFADISFWLLETFPVLGQIG